ncbi:MAG: DNA mismatch repair protein MutS [Firmicutes bacterium]|nr:DNA mismatch repair protein MutS [Bacillota bacterium]
MSKRTPMMDQYWQIKQSYPDTLLFFRLGDFYELFFDDAVTASGLLSLTLTARGTGENRMPMCGVPYHAAQGYIGRLVAHGFKVAICEQVEDPKVARGLVRRDVIRVVTPGTAHEYVTGVESRLLIGTLQGSDGTLAAAASVLDPMTGESWVREGQPSELTGWLVGMRVAELICSDPTDAPLRALLEDVASKCGAVMTDAPLSLRPIAGGEGRGEPMSGHALLTAYVEYTGKRPLDHLQAPEHIEETAYLHLSGTAVEQLELLQPLTAGRKGSTLFEVIDATLTTMGRRCLRDWVARPLCDVGRIQARQDAVAFWLAQPALLDAFERVLKGLPDLDRLCARVSFATASPKDLVQLARGLVAINAVSDLLQGSLLPPLLAGLLPRLRGDVDFIGGIQATFAEDPPLNPRDGGVVKQGVSPELDRLRDLAQGGRAFVATLEQEERASTGIRSLKIAYNRVFGYYIEVTSANLHLVPERYERKQTLAGAERFATPELRQREAEILEADERSRELEAAFFDEWLRVAHSLLRPIQEASRALSEIDALQSLAVTAKRYRYQRPQVDESCDIEIRAGRHPVVERTTTGAYVPNDVRLVAGHRLLGLLTGPNMAGKSTYMRQTALIVLLAQTGGFVPAESARIGVVDKLFTRIGASDDLAAGMSTFMVEMTEMAEILREATSRSLIVLDEVGRGTATYDGMSIAEAVFEHIHDTIRARTLFATHYHELTTLPQRLPLAFNLSVAVAQHGESIVFLHQVVERPADRSYGIQVAKMAQLPESVTERAKEILKLLETRAAASSFEQVAVSLFEPEEDAHTRSEEILDALRTAAIDEMTPREALAYLYEMQTRVRGMRPQ